MRTSSLICRSLMLSMCALMCALLTRTAATASPQNPNQMIQSKILNPFDPGKALGFCTYQRPLIMPEAKITLGAGGWRSTKTVGALGFCANMIATNPGKPGAPSTGLVILPTQKILNEFRDMLFRQAFAPLITHEDLGQGVIYLCNDTRVVFLSGFVPERIEWYTAAWAYCDEAGLLKETVLRRLQARISDKRCKNRRILFTGVPYNGWLRREFDGKDDAQRKIIHLRTEDNPYLDDEYIQDLRAIVPARLAECYLHGQFVSDGDVVYPEFSRAIHIIPWTYQPFVTDRAGRRHHVDTGGVIDWSPRRPHVLVVAHIPPNVDLPGVGVTERETSVVVDELYPDGRYNSITVRRLCSAIRQKHGKTTGKPYPLSWIVCDPAGASAQSTSGESEIMQAEKFLDLRILYKYGQRIKVGIQHVKLALEPLVGRPYLYFSSDLLKNVATPVERSVIAAMENYAYSAEKEGKLDDEPDHDDVYSHAADDVRYHETYFHAVERLDGV